MSILLAPTARAAIYSYQLPDALQVTMDVQTTQTVISLSGLPNFTYWIESSEGLDQWLMLQSQATLDAAGSYTFIDTQGLAKCFYRVGPPRAPTAPGGLTAVGTSPVQVQLAWTATSPTAAGFRIERSADGANFSPVATVGTNATSYSDAGLAPSATYYYRVYAFNAGGDSPPSNTNNATTSAEQSFQQNQNSSGYKMDIKLWQKGAQSFRHGLAGDADYFITRVVLRLSRETEAPNGNLEFNIGTGINAGAISGSAASIAPAQITDASAGTNFSTLQINFPAPVGPLTAGTTHYLNLECEAPNGKPFYAEYAGTDSYPGGTYYKSGVDDAKDISFEIWGSDQ